MGVRPVDIADSMTRMLASISTHKLVSILVLYSMHMCANSEV